MTTVRRPAGRGLLRLYPRAWRERYEEEMLALLEEAGLDWRGRADLFRGAMDARIHAASRIPGIAALLAGGLWTVAGAGVLTQPVPPDWPGHLQETLPFGVVAILAGTIALVGCWARSSDHGGRGGATVALLVVVSQLAWAIALVAGFAGFADSPTLAASQAVGATGCLVMGLLLLRAGDEPIGLILVAAPPVLLFGWPVAWLAFGLAWTGIGFILLLGLGRDDQGPLAA
ncbi:MAG TPA: hypothetical protein VFV72_17215 [Candidatus Limnocylindrales bacterium]|nr:hypothetical protein [Candidatus Limnocylindrales bacterium]